MGTETEQLSLIFQAPFKVTVEGAPLPQPGRNEALVTVSVSAISPGTEMLFYRGQVPQSMAVDETIAALEGDVGYPLTYGYALAGIVTGLGPGVSETWLGRRVFTFAPHQSHLVAPLETLLPIPDNVALEDAVLLPFLETAVSFLLDGRPLIGERVLLFGQGIIGLLTTALLAAYPLGLLATVDPMPLRRDWSLRLGANAALDPSTPDYSMMLNELLFPPTGYQGADLIYELSGRPETLDAAISAAGFDGRIIAGSWYGQKRAPLDLGGHFHRNQIQLFSSQVSHIAPRWRGRFDKPRRLDMAWQMAARHQPGRLITHRFPLAAAEEAYRVIDQEANTTVQVIFDYHQKEDRP
jgi:2-desacetyl-2-hydroxyethyl bacteriochlorophyllide A dehydrogenase